MLTTPIAIYAADFSDRGAGNDRHLWTPGNLRHVVAALDGAPVVLTTDKLTGHTRIGVTLKEVVLNSYAAGRNALIYTDKFGDHAVSCTDLGPAIVPITEFAAGHDPKWVALETVRNECSAAIDYIKDRDHDGKLTGRYTAKPGLRWVDVEFTPCDEEWPTRYRVELDLISATA
ncbi:hypothetical protein AB0C34_17005 [Nocardia sp. NPDC049220]|uniref:hypothetical protein n=1 Tax=Nocardia sp. NPDC049220 TaxID=3155273 RepID=UPI00340B75CE